MTGDKQEQAARAIIKTMTLQQVRQEFAYYGYDADKMTRGGIRVARMELFFSLMDHDKFPDFLERHQKKELP